MRKIIEDILKLPLDEKRDLYYALQEDLNEDTILREDELTPEQWKELNKRNNDVETGQAQFISKEQLLDYLKERRNALPAKKG
ncbi:MAG: addiction module protein [Bacteroidota bacterium]